MRTATLFLTVIVSLLSGCSVGAQSEPKVHLVDPDTFEDLLSQEDIQLIDVRTPNEVERGYLKGAQNINIHDPAFLQKVQVLDTTRTVLVYCGVGGRSAKAAERLQKLGFTEVYDLKGGIRAWQTSGKLLQYP